ncbi:Lrp/AsnC family transcriptional regulator [Nanoarchaeota archaeon]
MPAHVYQPFHISVDARINVVDIARKLKRRKISMTAEAVSYRLKRLRERKVIRGYRVVLDYTKLGYQWYILLINLQMVPRRLEMRLQEALKQNKKVVFADKVLGEWDLRVELLVKDHAEFQKELIEIRNMVTGMLNNYELFLIFTDHTMVSYTKGIHENLVGGL